MRSKLAALAFAVFTLLAAQALPAQASVLIRAGGNSACNRFRPAGVSISKGTKVVWKATCGEHTVTAYSKNWSKDVTIMQGQTTSRIFRSKGVFKFYCRIHGHVSGGVCSGMCGKITVGA